MRSLKSKLVTKISPRREKETSVAVDEECIEIRYLSIHFIFRKKREIHECKNKKYIYLVYFLLFAKLVGINHEPFERLIL